MKVKYVKITAGMLTGLAVASTAPYGVQAYRSYSRSCKLYK